MAPLYGLRVCAFGGLAMSARSIAGGLQVGETATVEGHSDAMWSGPSARNAGFPAGVDADKNVGVAGWKACSTSY